MPPAAARHRLLSPKGFAYQELQSLACHGVLGLVGTPKTCRLWRDTTRLLGVSPRNRVARSHSVCTKGLREEVSLLSPPHSKTLCHQPSSPQWPASRFGSFGTQSHGRAAHVTGCCAQRRGPTNATPTPQRGVRSLTETDDQPRSLPQQKVRFVRLQLEVRFARNRSSRPTPDVYSTYARRSRPRNRVRPSMNDARSRKAQDAALPTLRHRITSLGGYPMNRQDVAHRSPTNQRTPAVNRT